MAWWNAQGDNRPVASKASKEGVWQVGVTLTTVKFDEQRVSDEGETFTEAVKNLRKRVHDVVERILKNPNR
jgi:hypothetical protein